MTERDNMDTQGREFLRRANNSRLGDDLSYFTSIKIMTGQPTHLTDLYLLYCAAKAPQWNWVFVRRIAR